MQSAALWQLGLIQEDIFRANSSLEFCLGRLAKILNSVSGQKQLEFDNQNLKLFFISLDLYSAQ